MAEFVNPIVKVAPSLWKAVAKSTAYIRKLKENLASLEDAMGRLKPVYEDVKERVEKQEQRHMQRTNVAAGWLVRVQRTETAVRGILQEGEKQKKYEIFSRYEVGKRVSDMINEVEKLKREGDGLDVTAVTVPMRVNEMPTEKIVGLGSMAEKVRRYIEDTYIIGLYGLGGVGKTTLLTKINNLLNRSKRFEAVIWVSLSENPQLGEIQDTILRKLRIPASEMSVSKQGRANTIHGILKRKKYVLLLDDIRKQLNLVDLGVLSHDQDTQYSGSKVVFTTRSLEICGHMEAQRRIKVECLTREAAMDLFQMKVGKKTLNSHPRIFNLAETMAAECEGLPLALVTVGRAMATKKNPKEWEDAISTLRNSDPSQLPGMNDVLLLLMSSFERLENDHLKSCFLDCCIFPEQYNIRKEKLIKLWLGEGLLDEFGRLSNVQKKGESIIGSLKRACLLESGELEKSVRMHQMIRYMALWVCRKKIKIYVKGGAHYSPQAYGSRSWNETERISVWDQGIEDIFGDRNIKDSNLRTLIYRAPMDKKSFPAGVFPLMPALTVLDLSNSKSLHIGKLINLKYLNMSSTAIYELPTAFGNMKKLRCLLLFGYRNLKIQRQMISNFQLLEVFSKRFCDENLLRELEHLQHISEISIPIYDATSHARLFHSHKLQKCLKQLWLWFYNDLASTNVSPSLHDHYSFENLCRVVIEDCLMSDATWLICVPTLQHLSLKGCKFVKEVIGAGTSRVEKLFSNLTTLRLKDLPVLESICQPALPFPLLMEITVRGCPNLKKLPFDSNSAKKSLKQIYGERHWWDRLNWQNRATKDNFRSKFVAKG